MGGGGGSLFLVVMFLCCDVVKLSKAINHQPKEKQPPKKGGRTSVRSEHGHLCLHVQKLLFFGVGLVCFFPFWSQTIIKIGFLRILKTRFSAFGDEQGRVVLCSITHKDKKKKNKLVFQSFFTFV